MSPLFLIAALLPEPSSGAPPCAPATGRAVSVEGAVEVKRSGQPKWLPLLLNDAICSGDSVRIGRLSRAAVLLKEQQTPLRLDEGTTITFTQIGKDKPSFLDLIKGAVHFISRTPRSFRVRTPFVNAAIEGTEFALRVDPATTAIWVFQGQVVFSNPEGSLSLASGESAIAQSGKAPSRQIVVRPRDAVQWTLFYPPLVDYRIASYPPGPGSRPIQDALEYYRKNDLKAAFARLDEVPSSARTAPYYTLRAAVLLTVGRVGEARSEIARALSLDPSNGWAYALQSIIALVRNEREKALNLAERAIQLDPNSPVPRIALAYAYQGAFEIRSARDEINKALELEPNDPLAWALLAELELSLGYLNRALAAARRAVDIDPDLARTQSVLGFAYLTEIKTDKATEAFEKAIALDPAAPLPRLGLGLAKIRQGHLKAGTREIETAAILDPDNSLIRSYLGKAFYEQRRGTLASEQFALAKELDPSDPTPWFYNAVYKQSVNRPVEALRDLQRAIELNDNRGVYRSKLLLDDDLAGRSARIGRIYRDLGFEQLALLEGWRSVRIGPGNYSAHRLLADTYSVLPRHEIARDSELLQSQLLQPININPVQPRLADNGLIFLDDTGPGGVGFNEFSPMFTRNRIQVLFDGIAGNQEILANDLIISGVHNRLSFSAGQTHFETDGFVRNNDRNEDFYNIFVQGQLSSRTSLQAEFRSTDQDFGDKALFFDQNLRFNELEEGFNTTSLRLGGRYNFRPDATLIASYTYQDQDLDFDNRVETGRRRKVDEDGHFLEIRHLQQAQNWSLTGGFGYFESDADETITDIGFPSFESDIDTRHTNAYAYADINYPRAVVLTLGMSADFFHNKRRDREQFNPKFGLTWDIDNKTRFRAAAFRVFKRTVISSQTVEPTQVAGFNQFYDDFNTTEAWRYGVGLDRRITKSIFAGTELSKRSLDVPFTTFFAEDVVDDWEEHFARAYFYWTPSERISISFEYQFERFERNPEAAFESEKSETHRLPVELRFFHPSGLFATAGTTYFSQDGRFTEFQPPGSFPMVSDEDRFWLFDTSLGFRFPKRRGLVSLEIRNLFDEQFNYQDSDLSSLSLARERLVLARVNLLF